MNPSLRLLLLGGTEEGRLLAQRLQYCQGLELNYSLAGRTRSCSSLTGRVRRGGFGGTCGLGRYLLTHRIDMLCDATHPYAARISRHAAAATALCGVIRAQLRRPTWVPEQWDNWRCYACLDKLIAALPSGSRVFLTLGAGSVESFVPRAGDVYFLTRCIESPLFSDKLGFKDHFPHGHLLLDRGPFHLQDELALLQDWKVDILVSKNSGGVATWPKVIAARELKIPVWMLNPPPLLPGVRLGSVKEVLAWIKTMGRHKGWELKI